MHKRTRKRLLHFAGVLQREQRGQLIHTGGTDIHGIPAVEWGWGRLGDG